MDTTEIAIHCPKCQGTVFAYDGDEIQSPDFAAVCQGCGHRLKRPDIEIQKQAIKENAIRAIRDAIKGR
jgi:uncharacterized Zn finger protein (UPF0148 family)